jgi:outer membrane protein OmpA-like peptidoglycan-associated protein
MKRFMFKTIPPGLAVGGALFFISIVQIYAQEPGGAVWLSPARSGSYTMVERSDWSRYDNGKYVGHVYREIRASVKAGAEQDAGASLYTGIFFVLEETLRDMRQSARAVDEVISASFRVSGDGNITVEDDRGFPSLRGFPAFPQEAVRPGSRWTAPASRIMDPLNDGRLVAVPFVVEYEYRGIEQYRGIPVHRISAKYALRYRHGENADSANSGGTRKSLGTELNLGSFKSFEGQRGQGQSSNIGGNFSDKYGLPGAFGLSDELSEGQSFVACQGSHDVDILLRVSDGIPLMIRDILEDTFSWPDGRTVRLRGFTLIFYEDFIPLNRDTTVAVINDNLANKIDVSSVPEGVRLTIKDIRFVPDSDELLAAEQSRLDTIAAALKQVSGRSFLVEGHTAAVGRPMGELELSVRRAKRIVNELVKRGISEDRFMYKGWGGTKPVGDNETGAGRDQNRRVEITILD